MLPESTKSRGRQPVAKFTHFVSTPMTAPLPSFDRSTACRDVAAMAAPTGRVSRPGVHQRFTLVAPKGEP